MSEHRVLFIESPYVAAVHPDYLTTRCSNCFLVAKSKCSQCHVAVYCNRDCQSKDWPFHKLECKGLANGAVNLVNSASIDVAIRLVCRILLRHECDNGVVDETENFPEGNALRTLADMMSHSDQYEHSPKSEFFGQVRHGFTECYGLTSVWHRYPEVTIKDMLGKIQTNIFDITEDFVDGFTWLGSGLFLNCSRFDHSCDPDIHWSFEGRRIHANLLKPVDLTKQPLDQLTVHYGYSVQPYSVGGVLLTDERRQSLSDAYHFTCMCNLCLDDKTDTRKNGSLKWNCAQCKVPFCLTTDGCFRCLDCNIELSDNSAKPNVVADQLELAKRLLREAHFAETVKDKDHFAKKSLDILQTYFHPVQNVWCCRANLELFLNAAEDIDNVPLSLLPNTIFLGEKVLKTHEIYAPGWDLTVTDVAYRLSRLYRKQKNFGRVKEMLIRVKRSWVAKCGSENICVKSVEDEIALVDKLK